MKKYLFISHSSYLHGAELCLLESVIAFKTFDNNDVCVVLPYENNSELESRLVQNGATVISGVDNPRWVDFSFGIISFTIKTIKTFFSAYGTIKKYKPDIVIINSIVVSPAFGIASKILGCKTVWYIHELGDLDHGYRYLLGRSYTFKLVKWLSSRIVFNSVYTANHFQVKSNPAVLRYAVTEGMCLASASREYMPSHNEKHWNIVLIGRTSKGKGQDQAIEAARILRDSYNLTNFTLRIIGAVDGSYLNYLKILVSHHKLSKYIELIPFGNHVSHYLSFADIGITTSLHEAFGRITVEYLKFGLITVGAACGGTSEILNEFESSYLYEPNCSSDLANKLSCIFAQDPRQLRTKCAKDARKARNIYSLQNHYTEFLNILNKM